MKANYVQDLEDQYIIDYSYSEMNLAVLTVPKKFNLESKNYFKDCKIMRNFKRKSASIRQSIFGNKKEDVLSCSKSNWTMQNSAKSYIDEKGFKKQKTFSIFNTRKSGLGSQLKSSSIMTSRLKTDFTEEIKSVLPEIKSAFFSPRGGFSERRKESFERIKTQVSNNTADYLNSVVAGYKSVRNKQEKVFFSEHQNVEISGFGKLDNNYFPAVQATQNVQNPAKQLVKNPADIGLLKKLDKQLKSFSEIRGEKAKSAYLNLLENGLDKELMVQICKMVFSDPDPVGTNLKRPKKFEAQKIGIKKSKKSRVHQSMGDIRKQQKKASKQAKDFRIQVNELAQLFLDKKALAIPVRYEDKGPGNFLKADKESDNFLESNNQSNVNGELQKSTDTEPHIDMFSKRRDKGLELIKLLLSQRSNTMIKKNILNAKKYREFIKKSKKDRLKIHSQRSTQALIKSKDMFQQQRQTLVSKIEVRHEKLVKDQQKKKLQRKLKKIITGMLSLIYLVKFLYQMQRFILYGILSPKFNLQRRPTTKVLTSRKGTLPLYPAGSSYAGKSRTSRRH